MSTTTTAPTVTTTAFSVNVTATTRIAAPAEAVWAVLADTDRYGSWNPFVRRFDGPLRPGERITVELHLEGRKPQTMRPEVVAVEAGRYFEWLGGFGVGGVFDGRHRFEVIAVDSGHCDLVQSERLSGLLVPFFKKMLTGPTPVAFVALNEALKARVENAA